jgi:hypothetical protein
MISIYNSNPVPILTVALLELFFGLKDLHLGNICLVGNEIRIVDLSIPGECIKKVSDEKHFPMPEDAGNLPDVCRWILSSQILGLVSADTASIEHLKGAFADVKKRLRSLPLRLVRFAVFPPQGSLGLLDLLAKDQAAGSTLFKDFLNASVEHICNWFQSCPWAKGEGDDATLFGERCIAELFGFKFESEPPASEPEYDWDSRFSFENVPKISDDFWLAVHRLKALVNLWISRAEYFDNVLTTFVERCKGMNLKTLGEVANLKTLGEVASVN